MSIQIAKRQFTVAEYNRMAETGILSERDRVELIQGEIVRMNPIGSRHAACVTRLNMLLTERLAQTVLVSVQNPVEIDEMSELQPDVVLLKPRDDFYAAGHPRPDDILLVIEVADSSLDYERQVKLPIYAKAGIAEVWLVDLAEKCVDVYSQPDGERSSAHARYGSTEQVSPASIADLTVAVEDIVV